mgnify:CR=1 FL=1
MFAKRAPENWRQTSPQRIPCNSKLAHKGRKDTNPLLRIFLGRGFSYIAYLSNLRYHRITKQSGGCYNGKIHNGRTHRTYELVGDYYLVAGDEEPELEPIGIYGQRHRRYLSYLRGSVFIRRRYICIFVCRKPCFLVFYSMRSGRSASFTCSILRTTRSF